MGNGTDENQNINNGTSIAVYNTNSQYLSQYKSILDDFKQVHTLLHKAQGPETYFVITGAQKKLTQTAKDECDRMVKELIHDFTDVGINSFTEKIISLVTSVETTNYLYGGMVKIDEIKKYISDRITKIGVKRYKLLWNELQKNPYAEEAKLRILFQNIMLCKKVLAFSSEVCVDNATTLKYNIKILQDLVDNGDRIGLDNYTKELYMMEIKEYNNRILEIENSSTLIDIETKHGDDHKGEEIVNKEAIETSSTMLVTLASNRVSMEEQNKALTEQFLNSSNAVIKNASRATSGDFVSNVMQQFSSILSTVDTLNYLRGNVIDYKVIANNISTQVSDLVYSNYTSMTESWDKIQDKQDDDYKIYMKEVFSYKDNLIKAYELNSENTQALERYNEIAIKILKNKNHFKLQTNTEINLKRQIEEYSDIIKKKDNNYSNELIREKKDKKGFFSKLWG